MRRAPRIAILSPPTAHRDQRIALPDLLTMLLARLTALLVAAAAMVVEAEDPAAEAADTQAAVIADPSKPTSEEETFAVFVFHKF